METPKTSHGEHWSGTWDGLTAWEKLLIQVGFEVGYQMAREEGDGLGYRLSPEQEQVFLSVIRRKKAEA